MSELEPSLVFKFATEGWEFEQIHQLNYRTFVEEIPQHASSSDRRLVDKFHAENAYVICLDDRTLVGMMALRGTRPFSLDQKLLDLDSLLPSGCSALEIRLLAIEKNHRGMRGGQILSGMLELLWTYGVDNDYDLGVISATTRQLKLYQHMGFVSFGPLVGTENAPYQPMYTTRETFELSARRFLKK